MQQQYMRLLLTSNNQNVGILFFFSASGIATLFTVFAGPR
jgi:hypothetical protein